MADGPWTKFQSTATQESGPWTKFATPQREVEIPDAVAQAKQATKDVLLKNESKTSDQLNIEQGMDPFPMTWGGSPPETRRAWATAAPEMRKQGAILAGSAVGGPALEAAVGPAAEGMAGGSKILKWLFPALVRATGTGAGAGAGSLVGGSKPKEALKTSAEFGGAELGGEAALKVGAKVVKPISKFVKELTKSKVTQLEEAHAAEVAKAKSAYEEQLQSHKQQMMQVKQEHEQQLAEMEDGHAKNVEAHKQQIQAIAQKQEQEAAQAEAQYQKKLQAHKEKVADLNKGYQAKVQKFKDAESIRATQKELGTTVGENVKMAEKTISKKLGDEFQAVNEAVEKKGPTTRPTDATKSARSEIIFPDSLEAFNGIMKNLGENVKSGEFSNMRSSYTKLNDLLYGGSELPPDLYKAVKVVRDSLKKDLQSAAESVGMGQRYSSVMGKWSEFMEDWHDTSSLAKGGSPIARLLSAEDPAFVVDQFGGKASDRLIKTLEKYKGYGVNTELASNLKDATARLKSMSVPKEMPGAPKLPAEPQRAPEPTFTKIPTPPVAPTGPQSVAIPVAPQAPIQLEFNRDEVARKLLIDRIRKIILAGGVGAGGAYAMEKVFGDKSTTPVP